MTPTFLIPRDLPLEPGRKLVFTFTVAFEVTLDEDVLDYAADNGGGHGELAPATLDEVEKWMGGVHGSSEQIFMHLHANQSREVVEHTVSLDDRYEGADEGDVRFETTWEQKERERGREDAWPLSRAWLDHVPSAGALPLGPESNPPVPSSVRASDVRVEITDLEGNTLGQVEAQDIKVGPTGMTFSVSADDEDHLTAEEVMTRDG